jgi:hypothetical protein
MNMKYNWFGSKKSMRLFPVLLVLLFFSFTFSPYSFAQFQANMSSNCENGNCTTTICIDNNPCKTTNSNSTNMTSMNDLLQNKTSPIPNLPSEIV